MPRFIDEIDRLFDELVHEAWKTSPAVREPRRLPEGAAVELRLPVPGAGRSDIAFTTEGRLLTVSVRQRSAQGGPDSAQGSEERLQQTFTLPAGTEPAVIETRFEDGTVRIRVSLRRSGTP